MEFFLVILTCGVMYKVADTDRDASPLIWTVITLVICLASFAIPLPFLRVLLALVFSVGVFMAAKAINNR